MKYLSILLLLQILFTISQCSTFKNTTKFYSDQIGYQLNYQSFSGYEDINWYLSNTTASMYYSLWQSSSQPWDNPSVPLIIWLQGGPGSASQFGCFNQIGPLSIDGDQNFTIQENPWSWNFYGHVLCIDQPVGVGFSYNKGKIIDNTPLAAKHFVNFLYNFYRNSPWHLGRNPLYLAGQSYAGHYIPAFAKQILSNVTLGFNLQGLLIGDGYIDPFRQINNYESFLYSVGVISNKWRDTTQFMQNQALSRIMKGNYFEASNYSNFIIANDTVSQIYYGGMNVLNYRQFNQGDFNPNYYLFLEQNKKEFGVADSVKFIDDNQQMYYAFNADLSMSFKADLEYSLQKNLKVLIYNGQNDFIVNTAGVLNMINNLRWKKINQWKQSKKVPWKEVGKIFGWLKKFDNLIFLIVRNAGHLLPSDQPQPAWYMINNYMRNKW